MSTTTVTGYEPRFDIDLRRGQVGEQQTLNVIDALQQGRVEVKTDYGSNMTGNLYIEFEKENLDKPRLQEFIFECVRARLRPSALRARRAGELLTPAPVAGTQGDAHVPQRRAHSVQEYAAATGSGDG